jgi:NAD(P)-dependent dehydrogenase (short-subunit alcohol dehydrogenase family)
MAESIKLRDHARLVQNRASMKEHPVVVITGASAGLGRAVAHAYVVCSLAQIWSILVLDWGGRPHHSLGALATEVAEQISRKRGAAAATLMPPEKRRRLAVRQKIRTALTSVPTEQKLAELVAAIEEEMFSWGQVKPVTITITPHAPDLLHSRRTVQELAA